MALESCAAADTEQSINRGNDPRQYRTLLTAGSEPALDSQWGDRYALEPLSEGRSVGLSESLSLPQLETRMRRNPIAVAGVDCRPDRQGKVKVGKTELGRYGEDSVPVSTAGPPAFGRQSPLPARRKRPTRFVLNSSCNARAQSATRRTS